MRRVFCCCRRSCKSGALGSKLVKHIRGLIQPVKKLSNIQAGRGYSAGMMTVAILTISVGVKIMACNSRAAGMMGNSLQP